MDSSALIEHIKALENRDNYSRGLYVQSVLEKIGINYTIQECRWPKIRNIVVDFSPGVSRRVLFSVNYDAVIGSPGANDNASGVSVLLELCRRLRFSNTPLRIVFFDRE